MNCATAAGDICQPDGFQSLSGSFEVPANVDAGELEPEMAAEERKRRALAIFTASVGQDHPSTQTVAENLTALLAAKGDAP